MISLHYFTSRRKILSIQAANDGHQKSTVHCNSLLFREGSYFLSTVIGMNKYNIMEYNRSLAYKIPICVSSMKFSTASTAMLEETTEEEELSLSHYCEAPLRKVRYSPRNRGPFNAAAAAKGELFGDRIGWARARDKLTERKRDTKFERNNGSAYASKVLVSNGQQQALSKNGGRNLLVLQDHGEPVSSPAIHSKSCNAKVLTDSKSVDSQSIESRLVISKDKSIEVNGNHCLDTSAKFKTKETEKYITGDLKLRNKLCSIYKDILVVDNISLAKKVVRMLTNKYRHLVHACDTEVAKINVKEETPVDHGEITCFSIYSGPQADFGNGKTCIWVDVLDGGGKEILFAFEPFFKDQSIKKVWHNYSFDNHVIENYGLKVSGFHADTMHMARLWNSSRRLDGGYSLEALTSDKRVMCGAQLNHEKDLIGKVSMKTIFGRKKVKKDGSEGKIITIAPVEELQRDERIPWICYSALDARSTLKLYESLKSHLSEMTWKVDGVQVRGPVSEKSMYDFYEEYWRPFGELLVRMESEGMLVDRAYLAEIEKVAKAEQEVAVNRFRKWASRYCPDAKYMNVGSDAQLRQLLFGGTLNSKDPNVALPDERTFKIPNVEKVVKEGKKAPSKYRDITLKSIGCQLQTEKYTETGWPSVSGDALRALAGNASADYDFIDEAYDLDLDEQDKNPSQSEVAREIIDDTAYGTAFSAFTNPEEGREACHAIAALCEVCSIDSLISNFILPLQGSNVSGRNGRIHCSLNINTETGRLSARRPNLQNQPALEKDRYKIRQAFIAAPGNSLIVADYGQLELRILAHLASCKSMLDAFKAGGDFHSRTAMNMYPYIREAVEKNQVLLEWYPQPGEEKPPVPLLKDAFASERRKAKMLNFSIAYGKTPVGLSRDWKVSVKEAKKTVDLWYNDRKEVLAWQEHRKKEACDHHCVHTLLGRARRFPLMARATPSQKNHIERAAINTPVQLFSSDDFLIYKMQQGSAADVAMCAMLEISKNTRLKELGWKLLLQVHDEVILEGPTESAEEAKAIVVDCMSKPFNGKNILQVDLSVDAKCALNWYSAK
ncbi:DNA polymerase I A, chloroplastic/mitochondrial-like [Senna tora]|uniref:DNA-directed DNA polymerase n=1 Tax=Senna tora TaxID=362788 RepID=A0A834U2N1_9FABA|nr:DNA polymerase I A, chloroplastic/mitochondrial-like [Senna tora]